MDEKGSQKIHYTAEERARARNNRDRYKGFLLQYIEEHLTPTPKAGRYHYTCPFTINGKRCSTGTKGKGTGAFTYYPNTDRYYCHACETGGDIYDLMQQLEPERENAPDPIGAYLLAERRYKGQEPPPRVKATPPDPPAQQQDQKTASSDSNALETWQRQFDLEMSCPAWYSKEGRAYLTARGITGETSLQFDLKHDTSEGKNVLIIPYKGDAGYFYNSRNIKPDAQVKYYKHGRQTRLFNQDALYTQGQGHLFITEGEIDAMSITQAGGQAIALGSTGGADLLIRVLAEQPTQKHLILAFDQDAAGQGATAKASEGLARLGIPHSTYHIGGAYHDANDLLVKGGQQALAEEIHKAIEQAQHPQTTPIHETPTQDTCTIQKQPSQAEKASKGIIEHPSESNPTPYNTLKYLQSGFRADIDEFRRYRALSTGFASLDDAIGGGIFPGLYILGAVPGRGKTTFMLQLASQFAKQGEQVLFFSIEETALALTSKIISREASNDNRNEALQAKDIMKGYTNDTVNKGRKAFEKYANNLHIIPCNHGATAELIKGHVDQFINHNPGKKPIVIVDYLQALISNSKRSLREITDENTQILKQAQANHNLIFFIVSSFNRGNYTLTADFTSFKESGGIDYTGTNIWALELAVLTNDDFLDLSGNQVSKKREQIERAENTTTGIIQMRLKCLKSKYSSAFIYKLAFDGAHDRFFGDPSNFITKD